MSQTAPTPSWFVSIDWTGASRRRAARAGPYELRVPLGRGGSGEVWRAWDRAFERDVAVKVLHRELAADPAQHALLRHEARLVARLDHPHVVRVWDVGVIGSRETLDEGRLMAGSPYLVMELLRGGTLAPAVRGGLAWARQREVIEAMLAALAHVHARGVVHGDLKPANVLRASREERRWVLSDFGTAGLGSASGGSWAYQAPECRAGAPATPESDVWSLGCVVWELATGALPGEGPWRARAPEGEGPPEALEAWCARLLADEARERPSAAEAAQALREELGEGGPDRWALPAEAPPRPLAREGLGLLGLRRPPLVGRRAERRKLWERATEALRRARPVSLAVSGGAGAGRTRLTEWLAETLAERGLARRVDASGPCASDLRAYARALLRARALRRRGLRRELGAALGADAPVGLRSALGAWLAGEGEEEARIDALAEAVAVLARRRALVLRFEAPGGAVRALAERLGRLREGRLVVLVDGEPPFGAETVELAPLRALERRAFARALGLGDDVLAHLERCGARTPAALVEGLATLAREERLERRGEAVGLRPGQGEDARGIERRLGALAALLGAEVSVPVWGDAAARLGLRLTPLHVDAALGSASVGGTPERLVLGPALRERWLRAVAPEERRPLARAAAEALEARGGRAAALARLWEEAGEPARSAPHRVAGARERLRALDAHGALALLDGVPRSTEGRVLESAARRALGELERAEALARDAVAGAAGEGAAVEASARQQLARMRHARGALEEALGELEHAWSAATRAGDDAMAIGLRLDEALWREESGDLAGARRAAEDAARRAEASGSPRRLAMARLAAARLARGGRELGAAWTAALRAYRGAIRAGDRGLVPPALAELGEVAWGQGDGARAARLLRAALARAVALGSPSTRRVERRLGRVLLAEGAPEEADACFGGLQDEAAARGDEAEARAWSVGRAACALALGAREDAGGWLEGAEASAHPDWAWVAEHAEALARERAPELVAPLRALRLRASRLQSG